MKRYLAAVLIATVGTLAAVTGSTAMSGGVAPIAQLTVGINTTQVPTLDLARSPGASRIDPLLMETLMRVNPVSHKLEPWLAQSVAQPTPTTYVYHLRHGVKFWDGNELTADDVANSLNYYRYKTALQASTLSPIKSVVAVNRYTVKVSLHAPNVGWAYDAAEYSAEIFEKSFQQSHLDTFGQPGTLVVGTGPWEIASLDPTSGAELTANPHYWGGKVPIQHISFKFFSDATSMALAYRSGALDMALDVAPSFGPAAGTQLLSVGSCTEGLLGMNTQVAPWNDVHVRRAVAYAIDRKGIITAAGGYASPEYSLIPASQLETLAPAKQVSGLLTSLQQYRFDLTKAKQELAKSAYPQGFSASIDEPPVLTYTTIAQAIAGQLSAIGINLTVNAKSFGAWIGEITTPPRQGFGSTYTPSGCNSPDPSWYPSLFLGTKAAAQGGFNVANYMPAVIDSLMGQGQRETTNPAKRLDIYKQLLTQLASDEPYVPLFLQNGNVAISSKFKWSTFGADFFNRPWALEIKSA